ncbi:MAG: hypothetical protein AAB431_00825, partial [Patescibacteria group bacterium]
MIVIRRTTDHTNIVTRQERSLDLRPVVEGLRLAEAQRKQITLPSDRTLLQAAGGMKEIPEWYYDDAANSIQNGGVSPGDIPATKLSMDEIVAILERTVPQGIIGSLKRKKAKELG